MVISVKLLKLQCNFTEITLRHVCSPVNMLHIFRTPFPKNTTGGLLLIIIALLLVSAKLEEAVINFYEIK